MELISIIVPVYNVEAYVDQCIESIVNQTYRNLEILLIDDGSTDHSLEILDKWAKGDERIVVVHQENRGLSAARNTGLEHAHGRYIGFVDSDDYIEASMYATLYEAIKNNAQIAVVGNDRGKCGVKDGAVLSRSDSIEALLNGRLFGYVWDKLFDRSVIRDNRFKEGMAYEDGPFTYEAFFRAEAVAVCCRPLYHYRCREDSITCVASKKNFTDYITSLEMMEEIVKKNSSEAIWPKKLFLLRHLWTLYVIRIKSSRLKIELSSVKDKIGQKRQMLFCDYLENLRYFRSVNRKETIRFLMVTLTPWLISGYFCVKGTMEHCSFIKRKRNES